MTPHLPGRRPAASRWSRFLGIGAAATVAAFLGSAALAPYSIATAVSESSVAAQLARHGTEAQLSRHGGQRLEAAPSEGTVLDTTITAAEPAYAPKRDKPGAKNDGRSGDAGDTLEQFMFTGAVNWGGHKFTFYSQQVLPGPGLEIPGRHVNADGYVSDADGYIVLAGDAPKGTVFETPFGYRGKIYDRGTFGNHLDVYIR